jgi:hypothetical protein
MDAEMYHVFYGPSGPPFPISRTLEMNMRPEQNKLAVAVAMMSLRLT